ncbi:MAG TPA: S8 family serine peptidase [Thermoanaerobaculia bacterium]
MIRIVRAVAVLGSLVVASATMAEGVLIRCTKPCTKEIAAVKKAGGTITYQYKYVNGIAADVPSNKIASLEKSIGSDRIGKDEMIPMPQPISGKDGLGEMMLEADGAAAGFSDADSAEVNPDNYLYNLQLTGVGSLHDAGHRGAGAVIAIIDSGYRPLFTHVAAARVITPGINLVPGVTEPGAVSNLNGPHGTQVAGMAAASIGYCFNPTTARLARAALDLGVAAGGCTPPSVALWMIGGAPSASILPIKVFPAAGGSTPNSRTIQAMEKVIELRKKYDDNDPAGYNIRVVNLSLGGGTLSAGRGLSDEAVDQLLANDILPVISAGNNGFSTVTGGSPGTSMSALTVGASASAVHEWIYTAQFRGPCGSAAFGSVTACAQMWRPDASNQMSDFSSRGPTHDGRVRPDVIANGSFSYTQGSGVSAGTVNFVNGTSFSAPTVAGIATTLRQAFPNATARQVRNAIIMSANPNLTPAAKINDQGAGYIDAAAAFQLLGTGNVPDTINLNQPFTRNLQANMSRAGVPVHTGSASVSFSGIRPAETAEVPFLVKDNTAKLFVRIRNIVADNAPAQQNAFFGDDVLLKIQRAGVHAADYHQFSPNVTAAFLIPGNEYNYTFDRPATGVWRVTPTGDWTNVGTVAFDVDVWTEEESWPNRTAGSQIGPGEEHSYDIVVPAGTSTLTIRGEWANMGASYPINDVDFTMVRPDNSEYYGCATGRSPELCSIANPVSGTWKLKVYGYSVSPLGTPGNKERYTARIDADGVVLKPTK